MKCGKSNHFANVYRSSMTSTRLVANTTQLADELNTAVGVAIAIGTGTVDCCVLD